MTDSFVAPSSETSVELVELTGFLVDLYHAQDALRRVSATDEVLLRSHFVTAAVVNYWRCFADTARPTLDAYVELPDPALHEELRISRDHTVAHADAGLVGSHVLSVDPNASGTIYVTLPDDRVARMLELVDELLSRANTRADELHRQLARELAAQAFPESPATRFQ